MKFVSLAALYRERDFNDERDTNEYMLEEVPDNLDQEEGITFLTIYKKACVIQSKGHLLYSSFPK